MKKKLLTLLLSILIFSAKGQQLGKETWTVIIHKVDQLVIQNNENLCKLDDLLFGAKEDTFLNVFAGYKYFHLYVSGDTNCQILKFRLSNEAYRSKSLIGFFILREYFVFVHNKLLSS